MGKRRQRWSEQREERRKKGGSKEGRQAERKYEGWGPLRGHGKLRSGLPMSFTVAHCSCVGVHPLHLPVLCSPDSRVMGI